MRVRPSILFALVMALCFALASIESAYSATATRALTYTRATTYVDGSPLASGDIEGHSFTCAFTPKGATASAPCLGLTGNEVGNVTTVTLSFTIPSTGGRACFTGATRANGVTGPFSVVNPNLCADFDALAPSPPGNMKVVVTVTVQ